MITHFKDYALGSVSLLSLLPLQSQLTLPVSRFYINFIYFTRITHALSTRSNSVTSCSAGKTGFLFIQCPTPTVFVLQSMFKGH